jgi:hypothetical protein
MHALRRAILVLLSRSYAVQSPVEHGNEQIAWGLEKAEEKELVHEETEYVAKLEHMSLVHHKQKHATSQPALADSYIRLEQTYDRLAKDCQSGTESHKMLEECGGWSRREMSRPHASYEPKMDFEGKDFEHPIWYKHRLREVIRTRNASSPRIPREDILARSNGGVFCYAVVTNPPEPTFELAREVASKCDGYLFFSNFSDASRDIKQVIHGE